MKTEEEKIVTVNKQERHNTEVAFADFMKKSEACFNERSRLNPAYYKSLSPSDLEEETCRVMKHVAPSTPFNEEEIILVSGHSFPDIMAGRYYGVEVKSTKENKWTSVGSSIVESTRDQYVEDIYMMFGKLGGDVPEFKFRPYQDCLSNIAVTHSPRYLIDMEIKEKNEKTIFDKIRMPYSAFQSSSDKIEVVRDYYISQAREDGRHEMPWWVGKKTIDAIDNGEVPTIKLFNLLSIQEKADLKAQMTILFPQVITGDYDEAALWLCTHRYYLCMNVRDFFSAGGQYDLLNGEKLAIPYPAILRKLMDVMPYVVRNLNYNKDLEYLEFNPELYYSHNKLRTWISQVIEIFNHYTYRYTLSKKSIEVKFSDLNIDLSSMLQNPQRFVLGQSKSKKDSV